MPRHSREVEAAPRRHFRWARRAAALLLVAVGVSLLVFAGWWRGIETILSSHAIQLFTGQISDAVPDRHMLILYKNTSVESIFMLTSECSVAYLLAALFIGAAPLMLLRQLSPWRTVMAVGLSAAILVLVNIGRLTAIAATVHGLGIDPGLTIAHTYFGSLLTVVGTCLAGVAFAYVLVARRKSGPPALA